MVILLGTLRIVKHFVLLQQNSIISSSFQQGKLPNTFPLLTTSEVKYITYYFSLVLKEYGRMIFLLDAPKCFKSLFVAHEKMGVPCKINRLICIRFGQLPTASRGRYMQITSAAGPRC